jgi:putative ABC transport system permease protein
MYPELTVPLLVICGGFGAVLLVVLLRAPVLRRLALRQVVRRPTEAALVVLGSVLGTAIIVGSLVVGDTLGFSVRQVAYSTLGPVDERVVSTSQQYGEWVEAFVHNGFHGTPLVDGELSGAVELTAAVRRTQGEQLAEPRVLAFDVDLAEAADFGRAGGPSGLTGPAPGPGRVVVNEPLAAALQLRPGDPVELYLSGMPHVFVVDRVVPAEGLAGTGFGANQNRNAFLPRGTLDGSTSPGTRWVTWVSNRGGTEEGAALTDEVGARIRTALGELDRQAVVETPKREVLRQADVTGDSLGAVFLMIGSFSIIAGALLLVNVFVMLAEERKGQLGVLRASGLKRSRLVAAFTLEGAVYAVIAGALGVLLGIGVGRAVAFVAARIFTTWSVDGSGLDVTFAVSRTSLVNGVALGLVVSLVTVLLTSLRVSRFNIIAAIRDLETVRDPRGSTRRTVLVTGLGVLLVVAAVPAFAASAAIPTFVLPSVAMVCALPLLTRFLGRRHAASTVATGVLAWTLLVNVVRPDVYDTTSMAVFVVLGTLLAFSAVVLLSQNQVVVLRPFRRLIERPTQRALAGRLAVAYPVAKRFRTGATLTMYTLVTLVLVLMVQLGGVMDHGVDTQVANATAGYDIRLDFTPGDTVARLRDPSYRDEVAVVAPLLQVGAVSTDPGGRTAEPLKTVVVGVQPAAARRMPFEHRLAGLADDRAVWTALATHPDYVLVDPFFGSTGGPAGQYYEPGDTLVLTDPRSGRAEEKVIAGVLRSALMFLSPRDPAAFPVVMSEEAVRAQFGSGATVSSAFLRTDEGVVVDRFARELQARFLAASLVATPMDPAVRRLFDANLAFFQLMEGFLALGLLVGISSLGVVMVRAVRERRRTIGILRALGFPARTVQRAFLLESGFVAVEGTVLGSVLGVLTTWLLYERSAMFAGIRTGFPVLWGSIGVLALVTVVASLLACISPARRAARIRPALATRVAD